MNTKKIIPLFIVIIFVCASLNVVYLITEMRRKPHKVEPRSYQIELKGDSIDIYDIERKVGTIKVDSSLNELILKDNY